MDNNLDQQPEDCLVFKIGEHSYQKQVQSIMNDADCRGNFANYIIFRKNLLFRSDYFEICAAQSRSDASQKICKIYKKNSLTTKKFNMTNIRREIFVHKKLSSSDSILKFQEIFEYQQEIYLIFENAELLGEDFMISDLVE